jgi:YVTN family beta-propeller protein
MKFRLRFAFPVACLIAGPLAAQAQAVATIPLGDPPRWDYLAVDAGSHRLFVAHRERVDVIDTRNNTPVLQLAPTPGVHGAAAAPDVDRVFTSDGADDRVGVFDASTGKVVGTVSVGQGPDAIVYEPVTHRVFSFNGRSADVTAIDARSLKVLAESIPSPGRPEFAVADGRGRVYFNVEDKGEVAVLDAATLKVERHYRLGPCEEPSGLAIDPRGRLYSVCQNGWMVVSDPARGQVIGQAPIGRGPDGVAWLDGRAYSANGRDGTISVVAETAEGRFETVATLPTALGARTIAADAGMRTVFTATADFKPAAASAADGKPGRPEPVAGTFRVLALKVAGTPGPAASK